MRNSRSKSLVLALSILSLLGLNPLLLIINPILGEGDSDREELGTVLDYYKAIPRQFLEIPGMNATNDSYEKPEARLQDLKKKDLRNGYLEAESKLSNGDEEMDYTITFALFVRQNKTKFVAVSRLICTSVCDQSLSFVEYKKGQWIDISNDIYDPLDREEISTKIAKKSESIQCLKGAQETSDAFIVLPQKGTSLYLSVWGNCTALIELAEFKFQDGRFILKK